MKKQAYKIWKYDWMVSTRIKSSVDYKWFVTRKEAVHFMRNAAVKGTRQLFKVSYEFRDVMG